MFAPDFYDFFEKPLDIPNNMLYYWYKINLNRCSYA
jgi:hypothetical protein